MSLDYIIFDEAQEYFDNELPEFLNILSDKHSNPKILILYDPNQTVKIDFEESILFYENYFLQEENFVHYYFDEVHRCAQNKEIRHASDLVKTGDFKKLNNILSHLIFEIKDKISLIKQLGGFLKDDNFMSKEKVILVNSNLLKSFQYHTNQIFKNEIEELTEENLNNPSQKVRYTTPIKYRGMENKSVLILTSNFNEKEKRELFIGVTRAIDKIKIGIWKI